MSTSVSSWLGAVMAPAAPPPPAAAERIADTLALMRRQVEKFEADAAAAHAAARTHNARGDKKRAIAQLRRKNALLKRAAQTEAQMANLEQQHFALDIHGTTVEVVGAMRSGADALRAATASVSLSDVDTLTDDIAEQLADAATINDALGQSLGGRAHDEIDDDELELELDQLMTEQDAAVAAPAAATGGATAASTGGATTDAAAASESALRAAPVVPTDDPAGVQQRQRKQPQSASQKKTTSTPNATTGTAAPRTATPSQAPPQPRPPPQTSARVKLDAERRARYEQFLAQRRAAADALQAYAPQ